MIVFSILLLPSIFIQLDGKGDGSENRNLASFKWGRVEDLETFVNEFNAFYNDRFGGRSLFLTAYNLMKLELFGIAGNDDVIVGKDGWFFYNKEGVLDDVEGKRKFSDDQLYQMLENLEERKKWLGQRGKAFYLLMVPNKHTVYPEFLPEYISVSVNGTGYDQVYRYLKKYASFPVFSSLETLKKFKENKAAYHLTDTHWTDEAAFDVYQSIMSEWFDRRSDVEVLEKGQLSPSSNSGDLMNLLHLNTWVSESIEDYEVLNPLSREVGKNNCLNYYKVGNYVKKSNRTDLAKLYFMRDSFGSALIPYLSESFSNLTSAWTHEFKPDCIEQSEADIVIHEIVERYLGKLLLENPPGVKFSEDSSVGKRKDN